MNTVSTVHQRSNKVAAIRSVAKRTTYLVCAATLSLLGLSAFGAAPAGAASGFPQLGLAAPFAVLGGEGVTTLGDSHIHGALGSLVPDATSTTLVSGLLGGVVGTVNGLLGSNSVATTSSSEGAIAAATSAYQRLGDLTSTHTFRAGSLINASLESGVYSWPGSLSLGGVITLNALGHRDANFVFEVPGDLTSAARTAINLRGGAQASHVFWRVAGAANLAPSSSLVGSLLVDHGISLGAGSTLLGRALSLGGIVNLDAATIVLPSVVNSAVSSAGAVASSAGVASRAGVAETGVGAVTSAAGAATSTLSPSLSEASGIAGALSVPGFASSAPISLPFIPLSGIAVPDLAVPAAEVPQARSIVPSVLGIIPLNSVSLPVSVPDVTSLGSGTPSSGTTSSAAPTPSITTPSLSLGGVSVPSLGVTTPSVGGSSLLPNISLPAVSANLAPRLATPSTSTPKGGVKTTGHPKSSTSSATHSKSGSTASASGSTIPSGAPQTGQGSPLGTLGLRLFLALSALALAIACGALGARRRHAHGWR
ncbi:MAG TPA: ice-binding family protein [Acidimicrobiales bacterium]